jgi:DNA-binding GntR family transcriptional regulator
VPVLTVERYLQIREVRAPLERLATEMATPLVSEQALGELARTNSDFLAAEESKRWKEALSLNTMFHFTVYAASGNEVLLNTIENLWLLTGPFLINQYPSAIHPHNSKHPHALLLDAMRRRSPKEAGDIIIAGLEKGASLITKKLAKATTRQHRSGS